MSLLTPLGLLWLGSLPVLIWLWRLASTRRQRRIPSLVPFEHLLKRRARRRSILVVNALFWLQAAALIGLALALAQPMLASLRVKTVLVVIDTSASMDNGSAMERAKRALLSQVARKRPTDRYVLMTTSPVAPVLPQPTSDPAALARAIRALRATQLGGNLTTPARVGRALLSTAPEETWLVTDEPKPASTPSGAGPPDASRGVRWIGVGEPMPNVAIVGLDAQGPLCSVAEPRVIATIQNFSAAPRAVRVAAKRLDLRLAETSETLAPSERRSISLALPPETAGWVEVALDAPGDGLEADNRAWVEVRRADSSAVVIRSQRPSFTQTISAWLDACPGLTRDDGPTAAHALPVLITDREEDAARASGPVMRFVPPAPSHAGAGPTSALIRSHWVASSDHPIGSYLAPVQVVGAALNLHDGMASSGVPVVSAVVNGLNAPVVTADERDGRRVVSVFLDPSAGSESTPLVLAFFNSLRWLLGGQRTPATGEPVLVDGFRPGTVRVRRPDGSTDSVLLDGTTAHYAATTLAGRYAFTQGASETSLAVNFFDPVESNLLERVSTWRPFPEPVASGPHARERLTSPLASWLLLGILSLLLTEWWLWRGRRAPLIGWRKRLSSGCRLAAIGFVCAALTGASIRRLEAVPRHVIYLVDGSASLDAAQRAWMARRIASLEGLRPAGMGRAVIVFGAEPRVAVPFAHAALTDPDGLRRAIDAAEVERDQTNLETALLSSVAALPPQGQGSIVLLSDGRETSGNVTGILSSVRGLGLKVFPVLVPTFGDVKTAWETLAVPPVVQRGSPVPVQLVVRNGTARVKQGRATIGLAGVPIKSQRIVVRPGWQVVTVTVPSISRGTMALDVQLAIPEDGLSERRRAYLQVEGPPRILLVGDPLTTLPALARALKRREMEIAVAHPADLPTDAGRLRDHDAVLLFNVPKSACSAEQVRALRIYLEQMSGGLVMVGLGGDLAREVTTPSPLDELLPVQFEPKGLREAKRRVCIIFLIDRSASMMGPRLAATKRASVELVKQLAAEDLVGILAFDTEPYVVSEVEPAGQASASLVERLVKLRSGGGTDAYPALVAAQTRLDMTGASVKHVVLLSDGNTPFHKPAYEALVRAFQATGTTVSTIGIGEAFVNTDYMEWLARSTGGTFYQMRTLSELPKLVARDTQQAISRLPFTEGYFRPERSPVSDWFSPPQGGAGFTEAAVLPTLRGYFTATARPGARVDLTVNGGAGDDPLLARWSVGQGRVVSFTSDADARWSPEWIRWPGFDGAWAQVVRWAMRPRLTEELFVWVDEERDAPQLIVEGRLRDPQGELLTADGTDTLPVALVQTGPWRWDASLEHIPSGWYELSLRSHPLPTDAAPPRAEADHPTLFAKRWVQVGTPPTMDETTGQPPREALLRRIARSTSGAYDVPDGALLPPSTTVTVTTPLLAWWLPLALLLLLVDVALRGSSMV